MNKKNIAVSFGGKDSVLALHKLIKNYSDYNVSTLLTTFTKEFNRTTLHGTRIELLKKQSESLGIELKMVEIPIDCTHEVYSEIMGNACKELKLKNIFDIAFGDIFLKDVRKYREDSLKDIGINPIFPIWKEEESETLSLVCEFLNLGYKAIIICVDTKKISPNFLGKELTIELINSFPKDIDPCGENGEYHTFVFDGPIFKNKINFEIGDIHIAKYKETNEDRFYYIDLLQKGD